MPRFLDTTDEPTYGIGDCDRCHRKFPLSALQPDPNFPGLMVCLDDLDDYDPYRLPPKEPDQINLPFYRPDTPMTFETEPVFLLMGWVGVDEENIATVTNPLPVIETLAGSSWRSVDVAPSQTALSIGSGYLQSLEIVPLTDAPGAVSLIEGSDAAVTVFGGGSIEGLVSRNVYVGASSNDTWKVTTGADVRVKANGQLF